MMEANAAETPSSPALHVDLAQVCLVDGSWQDLPDQLAAFDEARLGASGSGRGSLYVLLDLSGEVEGRADIEREVIETLRREFAARRGSITFALSEALRAANASLFETNLTLPREARRMAGISAVALRGQDLYIAQAGPSVVYVEVNDILHRFPSESDWFSEDQPLISPQGNASAPLGVRREFACDLAHTAVTAGDVFVLATRGLTQLATTDELARAFANRGAEDIANFLEDSAAGADLTALVAELVDPRDVASPPAEPPADQVIPEFSTAALEPEREIEWPAAEPEPEPEPEPVFRAETTAPDSAEAEAQAPADKIARLREERRRRREAQIGAVGRSLGRAGGALAALVVLSGGALSRVARVIDWEAARQTLNRGLNTLFVAAWRLLALLVRLLLPGAVPAKQALVPRRASKEPMWLKGVAVLLPVMFVGLAVVQNHQVDVGRSDQAAQLVQQAQKLVLSAKSEQDTDKASARKDLNAALALIRQARTASDSAAAQQTFYDIQNQFYEVDGVDLVVDIAPVARVQSDPANRAQAVSDGNDIYIYDPGAGHILQYKVSDTGTAAQPGKGNGVILTIGDKVGGMTVDRVRDIVWAAGSGTQPAGLVIVTGNAFLQYDPVAASWKATALSDTAQWGAIRAAASYLGNIYLLDTSKNQIWKYTLAEDGYSTQAAPYLPANSGTDFSHAVDLAIDGDVWVLQDDSSVLHFVSKQRQPLDLTGLDAPLRNPAAIYTQSGVDSLYIADTGNGRLVVFDKTGHYTRQLKPQAQDADKFSALGALTVNENRRQFYFVDGDTVYLAALP